MNDEKRQSAKFCENCGKEALPGEAFCTSCGKEIGSDVPAEEKGQATPIIYEGEPPTTIIHHHLAFSIIITLMCSPLFGLVALFFSILSISEKRKGNYESATKNGRTARNINRAAVIINIIIVFIVLLYQACDKCPQM